VRLAIIGAGGHGHDIAAIAEACGHIVYLFDDDPDAGVPAPPADLPNWLAGVNDSRVRAELCARFPGGATVVHPSASVALDTKIGEGCVVGQNATIGPQVALGAHVHVNGGVFITRAHVGAYTTIGPNATICGDVVIGERCSIGAGAVVSNLCTLDDDVTLGAGTVVPPHTHLTAGTWVGTPARRIKCWEAA